MIRALLFLATLGIAFAAKCASIDNPKLHATFPSATSYPCFTPFVHTNGKCDAGFVEGKHGAPQMKCCGGNWSDSGSKYACVPAGPPPPSPPSPGPAPPSPGPAPPSPGPAPPSPGPAPPSPGPAPPSPGPAPPSPGPAPPSPSPPPPSPPTPPPPGKFNNYGFLSAGNTTCKGISWGGIVVTMGNATLLNSTANATISSVDASGCSTFVTVPPISQRIGNGTNVTHHAVNNAGFELKFVDESTATFHFQQDAIYHCQDYTTTPPTGCKYVSGSKSVNLLAVYVETTVGKANINATQPKFTSIGASKAYDCDGPVEFVDAKTNATVTFTGLELEAFVDEATESFAPIDAANSYCPATSNTKANKAGIIVGGIIAGLAAIGIIFFAYSKCSGSSGYQNLDKV